MRPLPLLATTVPVGRQTVTQASRQAGMQVQQERGARKGSAPPPDPLSSQEDDLTVGRRGRRRGGGGRMEGRGIS